MNHIDSAEQQLITLESIAKRAGASRSTVSYVLRGKAREGRVSAASATRILSIAKELGFQPNTAARAVRTGRFHTLALLLSANPGRSTLFETLWWGISRGIREHDLHLAVAQLPDEQLTNEGYVPRILRELAADGLLVNYNQDIPPAMLALIRDNRIPAVWMNAKMPADCVYPDDHAGGQLATEHLLGLGHRRVAFACYASPRHFSVEDRYRGYAQAMTAAGLAPRLHPGGWPPVGVPLEQQTRHALELLRGPDRPTAIVTYSGGEAQRLVVAACQLGLRLPQDLSLISVDVSAVNLTDQWVTHVLIPMEPVGHAGVDMLTVKVRTPSVALPPRVVPPSLQLRATCGPPASN